MFLRSKKFLTQILELSKNVPKHASCLNLKVCNLSEEIAHQNPDNHNITIIELKAELSYGIQSFQWISGACSLKMACKLKSTAGNIIGREQLFLHFDCSRFDCTRRSWHYRFYPYMKGKWENSPNMISKMPYCSTSTENCGWYFDLHYFALTHIYTGCIPTLSSQFEEICIGAADIIPPFSCCVG